MTILTAILTQHYQSKLLAVFCALFNTWTGISGHNFFHQRDNRRMKYFNLLFVNYRNWRVSHALSHHMYPNSLLDMEQVRMEPFFVWTPNKEMKNSFQRYGSYMYAPILYCTLSIMRFANR